MVLLVDLFGGHVFLESLRKLVACPWKEKRKCSCRHVFLIVLAGRKEYETVSHRFEVRPVSDSTEGEAL